jgi:pimeloyl-ACP methyl ester carboxylesterase
LSQVVAIAERFTVRSGVRIRYLDNAPAVPAGLPILFSPGFTDFADDYAEVLEFLAPRRALVVEVRGRGRSESPASGYTAADHARDLRAVLDEEAIDRFHLMTFSRGTTWGLDVALGDPARVASVSIGDYPCREIALAEEVAEQVMTTRYRGLPMSARVGTHVPRELFRASRPRELYDELAATGLPVMVATGTQPGCMVTDEITALYRAHMPAVEIVTIRGASHDLFRPDPLAYPRAVQRFAKSYDPCTMIGP